MTIASDGEPVASGETIQNFVGVLADAPREDSTIPRASGIPCGPGCVAIICRIMGLEIENDRLAALADTRGESSLESLKGYLETRGLNCLAIETTPSLMQRSPYLAILQLRTPVPGTQDDHFHFIVFSGGGGGDGIDYCFDPLASSGLDKTPMDRLADKWTGRALLVSRTPISLDWSVPPPESANLASTSNIAIYGAMAGTLGGVALSVAAGRVIRGRRRTNLPLVSP